MTLTHIRMNTFLVTTMFLLLSTAQAQQVVFSSDQWPKRWGRAMQDQPINGDINRQANHYRGKTQRGWGQQNDKRRHERSRTPEYDYDQHNSHAIDPLKQRYAIPGTLNYGAYQGNGYYTNPVTTTPYIPAMIHPGMYQGGYPGASQGLGMPGMYSGGYPGGYQGRGMPGMYSAPPYMGRGIYPGQAYPW